MATFNLILAISSQFQAILGYINPLDNILWKIALNKWMENKKKRLTEYGKKS